MNIYSKIITTRCYYSLKSNWRNPIWSVFFYASILHTLNILLISVKLGFDFKLFERVIFFMLFFVIVSLFTWFHYQFFLKRKSFEERLKLIKTSSLKKFDLIHLFYELITIGFLFYVLNIYWGNYFFVCLGLIGFNLIHKVIVSEIDEKS